MNYGELFSLIQRYTKRADLDDLIPDWIRFAQKRIDTDCRLAQQEFRSVTIPTESFITLPADFLELRNIQTAYQGALPLRYMTPFQLDEVKRKVSGGPVQYYTIMDNQLELWPAPQSDSVAEMEIFYYAKQALLTQDDETTRVLLAYPNLYVYATMIESMPFIENDTGLKRWQDLYAGLVGALNDSAQRARFSGDTLQMRAS